MWKILFCFVENFQIYIRGYSLRVVHKKYQLLLKNGQTGKKGPTPKWQHIFSFFFLLFFSFWFASLFTMMKHKKSLLFSMGFISFIRITFPQLFFFFLNHILTLLTLSIRQLLLPNGDSQSLEQHEMLNMLIHPYLMRNWTRACHSILNGNFVLINPHKKHLHLTWIANF